MLYDCSVLLFFFFSSRRRHTRSDRDWSSDVCSSDLYNAQLDRVRRQPQIQTQIRLLREGQEVFRGRVNAFDPAGQPDMKQLMAGGRLQIGTAMLPGQYILQVTVTDQLAKEKFRTATQWID